MSRLTDLLLRDELTKSERDEMTELVEYLEQVVRDVGGTIVGENRFNQLRSHRVNLDNSGIAISGSGTGAADAKLRALRLYHRDFDENLSLNLYDKIGDNIASGVTLRAPNPGGASGGFPVMDWAMQWDDTNKDDFIHQIGIIPTSGNSAELHFRLLDGGGFTLISLSWETTGTYAEGQGYDRRLDFGAAHILKVDGGALSIENETSGSAIIVNNDRIDVDFIVQGDTVTDLLKVDAGNEQVSIGGFFNLKVISELTIATGAITVTGSHHTVDTESDDATDDLATINGGNTGDILILEAANDARTVVVKHFGPGNIRLDGATDFSLDDGDDNIMLLKQSDGNWTGLFASNNG